jgi:hypothetical protein
MAAFLLAGPGGAEEERTSDIYFARKISQEVGHGTFQEESNQGN